MGVIMTLSHRIESGSEHVDGVDVEAAAVLACDGDAGLDGDIATPLSARTIAGIQLRENTVEVHVHAY